MKILADMTWADVRRQLRGALMDQGILVGEADSMSRWLVAHFVKSGLAGVYAHDGERVPDDVMEELQKSVERVLAGEPVQYVTGWTEFMGLRFTCDERALIPRPETEQLVEWAIQSLQEMWARVKGDTKYPLLVVDVGTGTGCIACSILVNVPFARAVAIDCSREALELARENAVALGVEDRIEFRCGDLLDSVLDRSVDVVVSNPPYISTADWSKLDRHIRDFEPRLALDGGKTGLNVITPLVKDATRALSPGGMLWIEMGEDQSADVTELLWRTKKYDQVDVKFDYAGLARAVAGIKSTL